MESEVKEISIAVEYNQQGLTLLAAEKYDEAIMYFNKAKQSDPMLIDTYFNLGSTYASMENYVEAEVQFKKAMLIDKTNPMVYFHLGNISFMKGNFNKGIEHYNKAAANGYEDPQMYYNLGLVYEEMDNIIMAVRNYSKAIAKNPLRADLRLRKANIYIKNKNYEEAIEVLEELNQFCPDIFEGYHLRFEIYRVQGRYVEAEKVINTAIELFPEDISLYYDKIQLYTMKRDFETALVMLDNAENMDGFEIEARNITFEKAKIYAQKDDIYKSIEYLEKLKEYENDEIDYEGRYFLMNAYLSINNYEKVLENTEAFLKSSDSNAYSNSAVYYRPLALKLLGRVEEAEKYYKEACSFFRTVTLSEPSNLDAYMFRALCHKDIKEYDKALELLDYILLLKSDSAEVHVTKSSIYKELGKMDKVNEELNMAKQLDNMYDINFDH